MAQIYGNTTPPAEVKYSVYEMENVSAYAKKQADADAAKFMSDAEAEEKYMKNRKAELIKDRVKKILIIAGVCALVLLFLDSGYAALFME